MIITKRHKLVNRNKRIKPFIKLVDGYEVFVQPITYKMRRIANYCNWLIERYNL